MESAAAAAAIPTIVVDNIGDRDDRRKPLCTGPRARPAAALPIGAEVVVVIIIVIVLQALAVSNFRATGAAAAAASTDMADGGMPLFRPHRPDQQAVVQLVVAVAAVDAAHFFPHPLDAPGCRRRQSHRGVRRVGLAASRAAGWERGMARPVLRPLRPPSHREVILPVENNAAAEAAAAAGTEPAAVGPTADTELAE
jgi:hypothetical protein